MDTLLIHFKQLFLLVSIKTCWGGLIIEMGHFVTHWRCCDGFLTWKDDGDNGDDILDISLQMGSAVIVCPQVVYSSSARELETVKPVASEKEEDDIDIDAI